MSTIRITSDKNSPQKTLLTNQIKSYFKILFDYRIDEDYKISSISAVKHPRNSSRTFDKSEQAELCIALCNFIEDATGMTYTEVDEKYGRERDETDLAHDLEYPDEEFPMVHYRLATKGIGKFARIHGYIFNGSFVVKRIDWGHHFHEKYYNKKPDTK